MHLRHLKNHENMDKLRALYEEAFPASEKKPFNLILQKNDAGSMQILAIEDAGGSFLGLSIMILHQDLALLDYFAILPSKRGTGIGTATLSALQERYHDRRILLEIEDCEEKGAKNLTDRIRRKAFYLKNGLQVMPYRILLFGVQMQILTMDKPVSFAEYHAIFSTVFSEKAAKQVQLLSI